MAGIKWREEEIQLILSNYEKLDRNELCQMLPKRTWDSIKLKASSLGLRYYIGIHEYVGANLGRLLEDTSKAFYWIGFLAADGSFTRNRLSFCLAEKDKSSVVKFCEFVECTNHKEQVNNSYGVKIQDGFNAPKIKEKFDFKPRKTYNPPENLFWMKDDLFISFLIGFIDGDGSIGYQTGRTDCLIRIKNHASWLPTLNAMNSKLCEIVNCKSPLPKLNNQGYAQWIICKREILIFLKNKIKTLGLPVLDRKWNKIVEV